MDIHVETWKVECGDTLVYFTNPQRTGGVTLTLPPKFVSELDWHGCSVLDWAYQLIAKRSATLEDILDDSH